jgi:hypothetical protein
MRKGIRTWVTAERKKTIEAELMVLTMGQRASRMRVEKVKMRLLQRMRGLMRLVALLLLLRTTSLVETTKRRKMTN